MIITLDGPAGSGKTTLAKHFAQNYVVKNTHTHKLEPIFFMSSGAFYRITTLCALYTLEKEVSEPLKNQNEETMVKKLHNIIKKQYKTFVESIDWNNNGITSTFLQQKYPTKKELNTALYDSQTSLYSAHVSSWGPLREALNERMRAILQNGHWIIEGRDAGSNIVKNPSLSIYLDANSQTRALRRAKQYEETDNSTIEQKDTKNNISKIKDELAKRDYIDTNKGEYSLQKNTNSFYIDTSLYTIEQISKKVYNKVQLAYNVCHK